VTLNTGDRRRFALVPENYDPGAVAQLRAALPKVPTLPEWEIARTEPHLTDAQAQEFWVSVRGEILSRNAVTRAGETVVLETALLAHSQKLSAEELAMLADLEQCMAIVLDGANIRATREA
jgi:hypothetical protein